MALEMLVQEQLQVVAIYHSLSLADVEDAMRHPLHTVGSDGIMGDFPHPRTYGTFPRILHHFSRQRKLFSLEEAVRKMTSAPAKRLGLKDRGRIAPGYCADVVLFSPDNFRDTATFQNPRQLASGLDWLFVNGRPVIEEGKINDHRSGHVLR
jgi:N-acyl-D-amino-acid deacylase